MKVISAEQAANLVESNMVVAVSGLIGNMVADTVIEALERRFLETGQPRDLTEIHPWVYGGPDGTGLNRWAHPGFLKRIIGSTYILPMSSKTSEINRLILDDGVEGYCWPANAIFQMFRAVGAGRAGYLTDVGVDTFADPRLQGCRINNAAKDDVVQLVTLAGKEHLFYPSIPIDVALIKASTADTEGNLSFENEGLTQGVQVQATAAHNSGGIVIAQVRRVVEAGSIHPLMVEVPGVLVDYVVVHEGALQHEYGAVVGDRPATTGRYRMPLPDIPYPEHGPEKIVARRALMEIREGDLVNIGAGNSSGIIPTVAEEEYLEPKVRWTIEHGVLGGQRATRWNPHSISSPAWLLDFYNGGGLDQAFLTLPEVDRFGNVNNVRLGDQLPCPGGFTDIAYHTKKVTFCGTMTRDGLLVDAMNGELRILREGCQRRFVPDVEMIAFSGRKGVEHGQEVKYITERAVFRLTPGGLMVEEVAPGVDLGSQVLAMADFPIAVSPTLKLMDARLFRLEPLFLGLNLEQETMERELARV
jgi:propionate CoA-transferase